MKVLTRPVAQGALSALKRVRPPHVTFHTRELTLDPDERFNAKASELALLSAASQVRKPLRGEGAFTGAGSKGVDEAQAFMKSSLDTLAREHDCIVVNALRSADEAAKEGEMTSDEFRHYRAVRVALASIAQDCGASPAGHAQTVAEELNHMSGMYGCQAVSVSECVTDSLRDDDMRAFQAMARSLYDKHPDCVSVGISPSDEASTQRLLTNIGSLAEADTALSRIDAISKAQCAVIGRLPQGSGSGPVERPDDRFAKFLLAAVTTASTIAIGRDGIPPAFSDIGSP